MVEYLPLVLTGIGIIASILYYASVLRSSQKIDKHRLFQSHMSLLDTEQVRNWHTVYNLEWEDYDDFIERYGWENNPDIWVLISYQWQLYNHFGHQVKLGAIDLEQYYDAGSTGCPLLWRKYEPVIREMRRLVPQKPEMFKWWEYLVEEMERESDRRGDDFFGLKNPDYNRIKKSISRKN
jgi:hypothetical protein